MKRVTLGICLLCVVAPLANGQTPTEKDALALDRRILDEVKKGSELMANLTHLSDVIGPRLTGSANLKRANEWAAERMKGAGLTEVHQEPWTIPEGWERGTAAARIVEPDNGRSLSLASMGWSPGTAGKIQAEVVVLDAQDVKALDAFKGKLKGTVVLAGAPRVLRPLAEIEKDDGASTMAYAPEKGDKRSPEELRAFSKARAEFLASEGAAALLLDAGKHFGLLFTTGSWQGKDRPSATSRIPTAAVAHNHYELLFRLAKRAAPARTRIELEIANTFIPGPIAVANTVGEIRGSEKPEEYVIVGAHLDSWDLGTGTTDNGTGTTALLEAARALAKCGTPPRRTIRFVLFTGEEQGLHGSQAYLKQHKDELPRVSGCIVHDTGTGKVVGLGCGGRAPVRATLEKELVSLKDLGVTDFTRKPGPGSDHYTFEKAGIPGFETKQEIAGYRFTHHSQADTLDRVQEGSLIQGAQVLAVTAMRVANLEALLSREKK
jgi:hypothetical protein